MNGFIEKEFHEINHKLPEEEQIVMINNVEVDSESLKKLIKDVRKENENKIWMWMFS